MKLRSIVAGAAALVLSASFAQAQTNPGTSPLTGAKGGTANAFMQFTGPATSLKTYTLPNASDTIATLAAAQTFTAAKTFNSAMLLLAGSSSGSTMLNASAAASGVLTLPAVTDTLVGLAATQTLTNKTLIAPVISTIVNTGTLTLPNSSDTLVGRATADTLTNKSIVATQLTGTLQAAQEPAHTGDCTNTAGSLALNCLQTNGVNFTAAATAAAGQLPGEPSTGNAASGKVGEFFNPSVAAGSAIALTTATPANLTSQSLQAGDWDVTCEANYTTAATTSITNLITSISTNSAVLNQTPFLVGYWSGAANVPEVQNTSAPFPRARISLSATTTVYCVVQGTFTASTLSVWGGLHIRRAR